MTFNLLNCHIAHAQQADSVAMESARESGFISMIQQIENSKDQEKRELILATLNKYSPDGYLIVNSYLNSPTELKIGGYQISFGEKTDILMYMSGKKLMEIIQDLTVVVHEFNHAYTHRFGFLCKAENVTDFNDDTYGSFFIEGGNSINMKYTQTFPSSKIRKIIPDNLHTFRFETYIYPSSENLGTQQSGIYGLLDELNAYRHTMRTAMDFIECYESEPQQSPENWFGLINLVNMNYYAYLEFKFFIFKYIRYAQSNEKQIHQAIMENQNFWKALALIDASFSSLINRFFEKKMDIYKQLEEQQIIVTDDDQFMNIRMGNRILSKGNFFDVYTLLSEELQRPEYEPIHKLLALELQKNNIQSSSDQAEK